MELKNINIAIPEELHRKLRLKAAEQQMTLKEVIINSLNNIQDS